MLRVVAATLYDQTGFQRHALLAGALRKLSSRGGKVKADVTYDNIADYRKSITRPFPSVQTLALGPLCSP